MKENNEDKIPLEKVLRDMNDDNNQMRFEARKYYYYVYASEEERKQMDQNDLFDKIISIVFICILIFDLIFLLVTKFSH